jgi:sterol desaturase/sphingolipid hydroxylase (fatty acid hydroxylase superfamily)
MEQQLSGNAPQSTSSLILRMSSTRMNYWAEFAIDIPLGMALIFLGLRRFNSHGGAALLTVMAGLLLFSLIEYSVHRWLFHGPDSILSKGHTAHHHNPMGYDAVPFFLPSVVLLALLGIFFLMIPAKHAFLLTGVIAIGYVTYGLSHFAIHHVVRFHRHFAIRWAGNHRIHHNHPETNFGVTTPLWDILLGSWYGSGKKRR